MFLRQSLMQPCLTCLPPLSQHKDYRFWHPNLVSLQELLTCSSSYGCHSPSSHKNPVTLSFTLKSLVHWGLFFVWDTRFRPSLFVVFFLANVSPIVAALCWKPFVTNFLQLCKVVRSTFTCLYCQDVCPSSICVSPSITKGRLMGKAVMQAHCLLSCQQTQVLFIYRFLCLLI